MHFNSQSLQVESALIIVWPKPKISFINIGLTSKINLLLSSFEILTLTLYLGHPNLMLCYRYFNLFTST